MKSTLTKHSTIVAALLLGTTAVSADVTPQQVWESWRAQMEPFGYEINATETQQGNDLQISDLVMNVQIPEEDTTIEMSMPGFTFVDKGDGTVALDMPANYPLVMKFSGDGENGEVRINYNTVGLSMVASGEPDAIKYTYSAASMDVTLDNITDNGEPVDIGDIKMSIVNAQGDSLISGDTLVQSDQKFSADKLLIEANVRDPEGSGEGGLFNLTFNDVGFEGISAFPMAMDPEDFGKSIADGMAFDMGLDFGSAEMAYDITVDGDRVSANQSAGEGSFSVAFDAEGFGMTQSAYDTSVTMTIPDMPFPIAYDLGEASLDLFVPLAQSEEEQDFKLAMTIGELALPDMLWSIADPTGQLPRDPATVSFDVTGTVKVLANLFDPEAMMMDGEPGELHSVSINNILVTAVGAELTGNGAFTFDNTDLQSFDGLPRPEGSVELYLTGANALMDKAVAMGMASEEDVMGARMMMGMFTVPGEGEDSLQSTIEVNAEGHVMANGMRLK